MITTLGYSNYDAPANGIGPFDQLFDQGLNLIKKESFLNVDAIILWGGADISPSLYKEEKYAFSGPETPSERDLYEWHLINQAVVNKIPIIGVCRGAQLLCAAAGGKLIQNVSRHQHPHDIITLDGEIFQTSSAHHQMMYPYDVEHTLLAWCDEPLSTMYLPETSYSTRLEKKHEKEPEVVYFPTLNALAIQGHPEWMMKDSPFVKWCLDMYVQHCIETD